MEIKVDIKFRSNYSCDAILAWYMLCMSSQGHCLSVRVCHKLVFYRNGCTDRAGFGIRLSYTVL